MTILLFIILLLIIALLGAGILRNIIRGRIDRTTVAQFDLERYMGTWYEIARLENRFERGMVGIKAQYRRLDDGSVEVVNSGMCPQGSERKISVGHARKGRHTGQLRVSFSSLFSADYNVLELGPDYEWALVGSHSAAYLWILSRTQTLPAQTLDQIKILAQARGYDVDALVMVDQRIHM